MILLVYAYLLLLLIFTAFNFFLLSTSDKNLSFASTSIENSIAMSKITATSFAPCQNTVLFGQFNIGNGSHNGENWNHVKLKKKKKKQQLQYLATKSEKRSQPLVVEEQTEPDYYSSRTFADIPLYESPWVYPFA